MSDDPLKDASEEGWIAEHRALYLKDGAAAHLYDTTFAGGPGLVPCLLLTTRGRKSGQPSLMPLIYGEAGGEYIIIASRGGSPRHPGWYHNLLEQDTVGLKVVNDEFQARWRLLEGNEREQVWQQMVKLYPPFADYQKAADSRRIPVIALKRA